MQIDRMRIDIEITGLFPLITEAPAQQYNK